MADITRVKITQPTPGYPGIETDVDTQTVSGLSAVEAGIAVFLAAMADPNSGHSTDTPAQLAALIAAHTFNVSVFKEV